MDSQVTTDFNSTKQNVSSPCWCAVLQNVRAVKKYAAASPLIDSNKCQRWPIISEMYSVANGLGHMTKSPRWEIDELWISHGHAVDALFKVRPSDA